MAGAQFWLIAGSNGAGKTSIASKAEFRRLLSDIPILNPDVATLEIRARRPDLTLEEANRQAAVQTERDVESAIRRSESLAVETVLSTRKYLGPLEAAKEAGYAVSMLYVAVASPDLAVARVALRTQAGGHDVPEHKIRERWQRSHAILAEFVPHLDTLFVLDNSLPRAELIARKTRGRVEILMPGRLPEIDRALEPLT